MTDRTITAQAQRDAGRARDYAEMVVSCARRAGPGRVFALVDAAWTASRARRCAGWAIELGWKP